MAAEVPEISYPALYTFRIIGRASAEMEGRVRKAVSSVIGLVTEDSITTRPSRAGNYTAVHVSCLLMSEDQRRQVYAALRADPEVILSL